MQTELATRRQNGHDSGAKAEGGVAAQAVEAEGPRRLTAGGRGLAVAASQRAESATAVMGTAVSWETMGTHEGRGQKSSAGTVFRRCVLCPEIRLGSGHGHRIDQCAVTNVLL